MPSDSSQNEENGYLFINNLNQFKKDINSKNNKSIVKKLIQTKKVRSKIIKLKQDIDKPDFGRN